MTVKGHTIISISAILTFELFFKDNVNLIATFDWVFYVWVMIGTISPDIDEPKSYIGRKLSFLSYPLKGLYMLIGTLFKDNRLFHHRGITHFLITPLLLTLIAFYIDSTSLLAFAIGVLLHDIGDMLTRGGIVGFLFPLFPNTRIGIPKIIAFRTGSIAEILIIFILTGYSLFCLDLLFGKLIT